MASKKSGRIFKVLSLAIAVTLAGSSLSAGGTKDQGKTSSKSTVASSGYFGTKAPSVQKAVGLPRLRGLRQLQLFSMWEATVQTTAGSGHWAWVLFTTKAALHGVQKTHLPTMLKSKKLNVLHRERAAATPSLETGTEATTFCRLQAI